MGADLRYLLTVSLEDAFFGKEVELVFERKSKSGSPESTCLSVRIPRGIENGTTIRLAGEGDKIANGHSGDLHLVVTVAPHPAVERHGDDLLVRRNVSMTAAALGEEVEISFLDGPLAIRIPPGIQSGTRLRLVGKGMPLLRSKERGNLYVEIVVETPTDLSKPALALMRQLHDLLARR